MTWHSNSTIEQLMSFGKSNQIAHLKLVRIFWLNKRIFDRYMTRVYIEQIYHRVDIKQLLLILFEIDKVDKEAIFKGMIWWWLKRRLRLIIIGCWTNWRKIKKNEDFRTNVVTVGQNGIIYYVNWRARRHQESISIWFRSLPLVNV